LYLTVGAHPTIHEELLFSLLSLNEVVDAPQFEVVIYSDRGVGFEADFKFKVHVEVLTRERITRLLNNCGFVLALKPHVIQDFLKNRDANVLYLDTDTFFTRDPTPLFIQVDRGNLIMHLRENCFTKRTRVREYIARKCFDSAAGRKYKISPKSMMWNAGVIGIGHSQRHLLSDVITLMNQILEDQKWHTVEQLAVSCIFQMHGRILPAESFITHYWFFRPTRFILSYYYNHHKEKKKINAVIGKAISEGIIAERLTLQKLPASCIALFRASEHIQDWHLYSLPIGSNIGRTLRKSMMMDFSSLMFFLRTEIKGIYKSNLIREIYKEEYDYI